MGGSCFGDPQNRFVKVVVDVSVWFLSLLRDATVPRSPAVSLLHRVSWQVRVASLHLPCLTVLSAVLFDSFLRKRNTPDRNTRNTTKGTSGAAEQKRAPRTVENSR